MPRPHPATVRCTLVASLLLPLTGCGKLRGGAAADGGPLASGSAAAGVAAAAGGGSPAQPPSVTGMSDHREWEIAQQCQDKAERECVVDRKDRKGFYEKKRAEASKAPFKLSVERAYFTGSCARGDKPEERSDAGVSLIIEGKITNTSTDLIGYAMLGGSAYLRYGEHFDEVDYVEKTYSYWGGGNKLVSRLVRQARGGDPWLPNEARDFHWESETFNSVACEAMPDDAETYLEIRSSGIRSKYDTYSLGLYPLRWQEVYGMAVKKELILRKKVNDATVDEHVTALFSRFDRMLVTRENGKTEWVSRSSLVQSAPLDPAAEVTPPVEAKSPQWTVRVRSVKSAKDFGAYTPKGEDQQLTLIDVELVSTQTSDGDKEPKPAKIKDFTFKLETAPGSWSSPLKQPLGVMDGSTEIGVGGSTAGMLAFPRQRFERPLRLQVKTPDKATLDIEIFSYSIGPERAPK